MAIQDNVSIIQTSQGSGSGWGVNYNIFTQLEEPEIKEGIWIQTNQVYQSITTDKNILNEGGEWGSVMTDLPYNFEYGSAVVYNGEIHILGGDLGGTNHYKWNGSTWTRVSTLPYNFYYGSAVVYNGEIHILGGNGSRTNHYKWNGSSWTSVSTLPYDFYQGSAVVYNGEIYIIGGYSYTEDKNTYIWENGKKKYRIIIGRTSLYKWDGTNWTSVGTLPFNFYNGSAVVYNGEIHILGGHGRNDKENWYKDSDGNTIYVMDIITYVKKHYKWNGSTLTRVSTLPYDLYEGSTVVYNGEIHILGGSGSKTKHYKWNGSSWSSVSTLPYEFYEGSTVVYNGESMYMIGSEANCTSYSAFTSPEKLFNPYTLIIQRGNTSSGVYQACLVNTFDDIVGENNRLLTGFDDIWYFLETKLDTSSPVYYGDGTKWIKLKN